MQAGEECPSVDSEQVSVDPSGSRPEAPELRSRHVLKTEPGGRGMEAAPSNGELHMASVWRSGSGLICVEHDYALPAMIVPTPIAPGTGHSTPRMAQNQFVCLSSDPGYSIGAIQNTVGQSGATAAGSSVVAHSAVACGTDQSVPWKIPLRQDMLSQARGMIWHPRTYLWKLWVWPLSGVS